MRRRDGQSTVEYIVLVIIIICAFVATQSYIKRGIQGRWKSSVDEFGDQYDPKLINSEVVYALTANTNSIVTATPGLDSLGNPGVFTNRIDGSETIERRYGYTAVGACNGVCP